MDTKKNDGWWRSSVFKIYCSHVLSSWGDRMWSFALGIYLFYLNPKSLQLTAVYGFSSCISVILVGALIGKWIDKSQRLRAAQVSLIVQNLAVVFCAILVIIKLKFTEEIDAVWDGSISVLMIVVIIFTGVIADLGSVATKIALEKDWIVVLSNGDENKLAKMNSVMRTIDLTTSILAPIIVGQILTFLGQWESAAFIVSWNIVSVMMEYLLLISIYKQMPELIKKLKPAENLSSKSISNHALLDNLNGNGQTLGSHETSGEQDNGMLALDGWTEVSLVTPDIETRESKIRKGHQGKPNGVNNNKQTCLSEIKTKFSDTVNGWKDYFNHHVRNAGLALALLYMTVLGFDNITRGFALSQGVSESFLGIFTAIGAVFGILGSLSFPCLRKRFGKLTTGNIGFGSETFCLLICVISIFTPGSPFVHYDFIIKDESERENSNSTGSPGMEAYSLAHLWKNNISVLLLLTGIVTARFGLWLADLSVSQIFQESIAETQRGVINGVQGSLNQGMNLIKFTLVIILPNPDTFAYLIAVSWLAILIGWILFMVFSCKKVPTEESVSSQVLSVPTISSSIAAGEKEIKL